WYPNQVGNPMAAGQSRTLNQWFNPNAFQAPPPGTLGNMRRNSVYGPGLHVINGSIHKTFPIYERFSFEFAANATNLINHPSFADPDTQIDNNPPDPTKGYVHHAQITGVTVGGRVVELVGHLRF